MILVPTFSNSMCVLHNNNVLDFLEEMVVVFNSILVVATCLVAAVKTKKTILRVKI